jgi:PPOX class probable F420-dependent enzyme
VPSAGSIRLTDDEAWNVIAASDVGVLTTLRADGWPVSLPVWFVAHERTVCLAAPTGTKKVARVRRDPRASFLVESGALWSELRAVHLTGLVEIVTQDSLKRLIADAIDEKYATRRTDQAAMPTGVQDRYRDRTFLQLRPESRVLSWDNSRIVLTSR